MNCGVMGYAGSKEGIDAMLNVESKVLFIMNLKK
jgi:hypothetical protein